MSGPPSDASAGAPAPEVSVVIVAFRCADLLRTCLHGLEAQRDDVAMEVTVLDNASGDATPRVADEFPWVSSVPLPRNIGFARANNLGMTRARGRAVLVLNPDTSLPQGSLRACLDALWAAPDVGVLGPRLVDAHGTADRRARRSVPTVWGSLCFLTGLDRVLRDRRSRSYTLGWLPDDVAADVPCVSGAFMLCRADALAEVGLFDERFFMYAEDMDLCVRMAAAGWRVRYWPGVDVRHVGGGSNAGGRRPPAADAAFFRTMAPFMRKHRPGWRGAAVSGGVRVMAEGGLAASRGARVLRPLTRAVTSRVRCAVCRVDAGRRERC